MIFILKQILQNSRPRETRSKRRINFKVFFSLTYFWELFFFPSHILLFFWCCFSISTSFIFIAWATMNACNARERQLVNTEWMKGSDRVDGRRKVGQFGISFAIQKCRLLLSIETLFYSVPWHTCVWVHRDSQSDIMNGFSSRELQNDYLWNKYSNS